MKSWPYVYQKKDGRWVCDTGEGKVGKRRRAFFQSQSEADDQATTWKKEYAQGGSVAFMKDDQRLDAINAIKLFEARSVPRALAVAAQYYLDHKFPIGGNLTVSKALDAYLAEKEFDRDLTQVYRYSFNRLERLRDEFADTKLANLDTRSLDTFIRNYPKWGAESQRQHHIYFKMFFRWCVKKQYLHVNPLDAIKVPKGTQEQPGILEYTQVQKLITAAWTTVEQIGRTGYDVPYKMEDLHEQFDYRYFPYLVLGLYLGIRPHEVMRLSWGDFSMRYEFLTVQRKASKTSDKRNVPIPLAAQVMLKNYVRIMEGRGTMDPGAPVIPGDYDWLKKKMRDWRTKQGIKTWPHDAMRHTFASYFLAAHAPMAELIERMGHSTSRTTLKHYVRFIDNAYWKDYWVWAPGELQQQLLAALPQDEEKLKTAVLRLPT